jgi:hypothetical protein
MVGVGCAAAASALMSMVLADPAAVAGAIARREYADVAVAVLRHVGGWLHALLRFL